MYKELEGITPPGDKSILWRYMSLEKFVSLLATESLFFTRVDRFEDPFEGFRPPLIKYTYELAINQAENTEKAGLESAVKAMENWHKYIMCNCWHQNEEESMAMWEKYQMRNSGIAIKTTMKNLKKSLSDELDVFIGQIKYSSPETYEMKYIFDYVSGYVHVKDSSDTNTPFYFPYFFKRKAYEYEQEVRLIIDSHSLVGAYWGKNFGDIPLEDFFQKELELPEIWEIGMPLKVDVQLLIGETGEIIISPYTEDWVTEAVRSVVRQYGFDFKVNRSTLLDASNLDYANSVVPELKRHFAQTKT